MGLADDLSDASVCQSGSAGIAWPSRIVAAGKNEQRRRAADAPRQPVIDDVTDMAAARGDAGYGGDVIGLERMLHACRS